MSKEPEKVEGHFKFDDTVDVEVDLKGKGKKVVKLRKQYIDTDEVEKNKVTLFLIIEDCFSKHVVLF